MKTKKQRNSGNSMQVKENGPVTRNAVGVMVAVHGDDRGTVERRQHDPAAVVDTYAIDDNGDATRARAVQVSDCLDRMLANGTISQAMVDAGRRFQQDFHNATLHPLRAAPLEPQIKGQHDDTRTLSARDRVWRATRAMGGFGAPAANALWFVIGAGYSIEGWAQRERLGKGRTLNPHCARGILIGALSALQAHYDRRS